jgi:hypothetical protein
MGFLRDAGAALTMGLTATSKQKEAEARFREREQQHHQAIGAYNSGLQQTHDTMMRLEGYYHSASQALIKSGAVTVDAAGNVALGWYNPVEAAQAETAENNTRKAVIASLPAFGTAIGAPVITWTLVGALGTAATGTAISTLSGAAVGAATAAWIGRAATFGIAGATAGRFALGPIALISLPVQAAIGAKLAGNNERRRIRQFEDATADMHRTEQAITDLRNQLSQESRQAERICANISRHAIQLETAGVDRRKAMEAATWLDSDMSQAVSLLADYAETLRQQKEFETPNSK